MILKDFLTDSHNHLPEYFGELGVGKGKSPESEIAGSVRNSAENVFDRVDSLEDHDLLEVGLFAGSFGPVLCDQWLGKQHPGNADLDSFSRSQRF